MTINKYKYFLLFYLISFYLPAQDIFDLNNSRKYADYLFNTENFEGAINEYERCLFMEDSLYFKNQLLVSFRKANKYKEGIARMYRLNYAQSDTLIIEGVKLAWLERKNNLADSLTSLLRFTDKVELQVKTNLLVKNFSKAAEYNNILSKKEPNNSQGYQSLIDAQKVISKKSPFTAGVLSTIVPGLGKVYSNAWKDGLISFISIGSFAYQAYRGFSSEKGIRSFKGWAMGSITMGFYLGNIFGGVKAAKKHNFTTNEQFENKVRTYCLGDL
jgi:hypothetical protein